MTTNIPTLVADTLDLWTSATQRKSSAGRGGGKRISLYGIERLRALILDLAVRGKLVPQDARDEPARELLKKFKAQRAVWISEKRIRKGKPLEKLSDDEFRFSPPIGWEWTRFGHLGDWGAGATPNRKTSSYYGGETPWFKSGELVGDYISLSEETVTELALRECSLRLNAPGDVLIAMYGATIGKTSILEVAATTNQAVCACTPFDGVFNRYLLLVLKAMRPNFIGQGAGGAQPNISREKIIATPLCLPPLAEQRRIVAKVDELMALCDALERESADAMAAHQALVEELLGTLVNSADAADLATNWARLESHFDTLFTTDASIEALKQTILDLAVRGKLVEQDAGDEPAIKKIKGPNTKAPFAIPANWQCVPLQALGRQLGGGTPSKSRSDFWEGPIPWVSPKDMKKDYLFEAEMSVSESALTASAVKLIAPESLMFVVRGMILAHSFPVAIAKTPVTINQDMKAIELDQPAMADYLLRALKGLKPLMLARVERSSHGTCRLDSAAYATFPVPIPPLAEQQRIVAKVDALMALCNQLKTCLADAAQTQRHLADAITERAAA